jgi:hypothetical protein
VAVIIRVRRNILVLSKIAGDVPVIVEIEEAALLALKSESIGA